MSPIKLYNFFIINNISYEKIKHIYIHIGVLLRRQRIPMPDPVRYRFYDIIDLNIGKEPEIYGRVYKIVDCDKFTRQFLNRMGIPVPDPIEIPKDPHMELHKQASYVINIINCKIYHNYDYTINETIKLKTAKSRKDFQRIQNGRLTLSAIF